MPTVSALLWFLVMGTFSPDLHILTTSALITVLGSEPLSYGQP